VMVYSIDVANSEYSHLNVYILSPTHRTFIPSFLTSFVHKSVHQPDLHYNGVMPRLYIDQLLDHIYLLLY